MRVLVIALLALTLWGCDYLTPATPIGEVLATPAQFEGKEVHLRGKVTDITKIPVLEIRTYTLRDESGEITISTQADLPAQGAEVRVKGRVESAAILGGKSVGMRVREVERF